MLWSNRYGDGVVKIYLNRITNAGRIPSCGRGKGSSLGALASQLGQGCFFGLGGVCLRGAGIPFDNTREAVTGVLQPAEPGEAFGSPEIGGGEECGFGSIENGDLQVSIKGFLESFPFELDVTDEQIQSG